MRAISIFILMLVPILILAQQASRAIPIDTKMYPKYCENRCLSQYNMCMRSCRGRESIMCQRKCKVMYNTCLRKCRFSTIPQVDQPVIKPVLPRGPGPVENQNLYRGQ